MNSEKKIKLFLVMCPVLSVIMVFALILMVVDSSNGDASAMSVKDLSDFQAPFDYSVEYHISSNYGFRNDPYTNEQKHHSGIDLVAKEGTYIVASAGGKVYKTGYEDNGLGNYVKLEHDVDGITYYTAYGHMLDNSIVVHEGEVVEKGQVLGVIGSSGKATGIHVHFMLMSPNCTYTTGDLKDPTSIINNDLEYRKKQKELIDKKYFDKEDLIDNERFKRYQPQ